MTGRNLRTRQNFLTGGHLPAGAFTPGVSSTALGTHPSTDAPKHSSHILELARKGAEHRYEELKAEIAALVKSFPHLSGRRRRTTIDMSAEPAAMIDGRPRKRRKMSAAARRKISLAQKRRWAKQKATSKS